MTIYTIGHSTRGIEEFVGILEKYGIGEIVDVRTIPRSKHNPQFNQEPLKASLNASRIGYVHMPGLGGLRRPLRDSPNMGRRNASFRGYADYMQTAQFNESLLELIKLAEGGQVAIMCAEVLPWRCHRSLIADTLKVRGVDVVHIIDTAQSRNHVLTPWIKIEGKSVTYP